MISAVCQGLLSCGRHIGKREDPGDEVVHVRGFTAGQKDCGKSGLGHRAAGPPGRRAAGPLGRGPAFSKTQFSTMIYNRGREEGRAKGALAP